MKALLLLLMLATTASASQIARSTSIRAEFQRHTPCPSTGAPRGRCPGYVVDHITPLCAGGADHPGNLQWQTVHAAKLKDRQEHRLCRDLKF